MHWLYQLSPRDWALVGLVVVVGLFFAVTRRGLFKPPTDRGQG